MGGKPRAARDELDADRLAKRAVAAYQRQRARTKERKVQRAAELFARLPDARPCPGEGAEVWVERVSRLASEMPEEAAQVADELIKRAALALALDSLWREGYRMEEPDPVANLLRSDLRRPHVVEGLAKLVQNTLAQREGADSMVARQRGLEETAGELRRIGKELGALTGHSPVAKDCLILARAAVCSAEVATEIPASQLRAESRLNQRGRGRKHDDDRLVSTVAEVLSKHKFKPAEQAAFVIEHLPGYWRACLANHGGSWTKAKRALAKNMTSRARDAKKRNVDALIKGLRSMRG